jgi:hypothetical protein
MTRHLKATLVAAALACAAVTVVGPFFLIVNAATAVTRAPA